jgi:2-polyprenyl-3-methyl-5-hydroxy-6-metoxy-1,4-benzoquinol methylase
MNSLTQDYGWTSSRGPASVRYITPVVLEILQRHGAKRVIDLGSGNGATSARLANAGLEVVGVEYDAGGVAVAKSAYPRIPFYRFGVQDDPQELLASEAPFDAVVSTEVIEHLFAPHHLPIYARQVLKPGGRLIISTPYHGYLKNVAVAVSGKWDRHHTSLWCGGHIKFWSRATLTKLLEGEGFRVTEFHGAGRFPYLWKSMVLVAEKT